MSKKCVILDCFTVEPSGLGFPPYMGSYPRYAYACLSAMNYEVFYCTIDDFRFATNRALPATSIEQPTNPYAYSLTRNAARTLDLINESEWLILIAGDTVPSKHIQAISASIEELTSILSCAKGKAILVGPLAFGLTKSQLSKSDFIATHTHMFLPRNLLNSSVGSPSYEELEPLLSQDFERLLMQVPWEVIAEIEMYRGCTRKVFCSFCFEPVKNEVIEYRTPDNIVAEIIRLYNAGVHNFRLGQQACFFSYQNRNVEQIYRLLSDIRENCPGIKVLHIDNVDPLAAASPSGRQIAKIVADLCTPGNCAPMGIESFDLKVINQNSLTCTPEILLRAMANIEEFGAERTTSGLCKFLPGLNLIYGLAGETDHTHEENLKWLQKIYDEGHFAARTNIREAHIYEDTPFAVLNQNSPSRRSQDLTLDSCKSDIADIYTIPMKKRVYPSGTILRRQHAFFKDQQGTWFRKIGSYPIMVVVQDEFYSLFVEHDVEVSDHRDRYVIGKVVT